MHVELSISKFSGFKSECRTLWHDNPSLDPVLLVGGATHHKEDWGRLEALLARETTVVTVDLPGWGSADILPAEYDVDFLANCLAETLHKAGHQSVHIFAGSYGSLIVYRFGQLYPACVRKLAMFGAMSRIPDAVRAAVSETLTLLEAGRREEFADCVLHTMLCPDPTVTIFRRETIRRILRRVFRDISADDAAKYIQNTRRLLEQSMYIPEPVLTAPLLFGVGEYDTFTNPECCRELAQDCNASTFLVMRNVDHPLHLERPDELADLLLRFFSDQPVDTLPYCLPGTEV